MRGELIEVLLGLLLGMIAERWVRPIISQWLTRIETQRARNRYEVTRVPNSPQAFTNYRLGNIEVAVMNLVGSPETPFGIDEVKIKYSPLMHHQQSDYPVYLADAKPYLQQLYLKKYGLESLPEGYRNVIARISDYEQEGETLEDKRGGLILYFNLTSFDTYLMTNRSLDYSVIPQFGTISRFTKNQTIRRAYTQFPYDLQNSVLANPLAVIIVVISRNLNQSPQDQVIIRLRSQKVASYRNRYQVSAAGYMSISHKDEHGVPNPFVTAVDEARQEISDGLQLSPSDFKLIGIALSWEDMLPCAYGYIETGKSVQDLLGDFRRDTFEGGLSAIPFEPKTVLSHIAKNKWTPESVLAMCAALLVYFPREEVEGIARKIPAKSAREFYEDE